VSEIPDTDQIVPDSVIPHGSLPPLRKADVPEPVPWNRMLGPSIVLVGFAIGSGEFVLWPRLVHQHSFAIFWLCLVGVGTQFFVNMEIERWALTTGECAVTGFARLWKHWAWVFLLCNIIPWLWPGWACGAAELLHWSTGVPAKVFSIGSLIGVGVLLTLGPVLYKTVERVEAALVAAVFVFVIVLVAKLATAETFAALVAGFKHVGKIPEGIELPLLLGALAFAGVGGTGNLGQAHYVRDKGYAMGRLIGRITSPVTGEEEAASGAGYHFEHTDENMARWRAWWRAANIEHFFSFFLLCVITLVLLCVLMHATIGQVDDPGAKLGFIKAQRDAIADRLGSGFGVLFVAMGVAVFLSSELGVLDVASRISAEIVKTNYLLESRVWTKSRLYFAFLWAEIAFGCIVLFAGFEQPFQLLVLSASLSGGVMALYCLLLLYMNTKILGRKTGMGWFRFLMMVWACALYGYFSLVTLAVKLPQLWGK